jgi:hypothetical protein
LGILLTNGRTTFAEIAELPAGSLGRFRRLDIKANLCV